MHKLLALLVLMLASGAYTHGQTLDVSPLCSKDQPTVLDTYELAQGILSRVSRRATVGTSAIVVIATPDDQRYRELTATTCTGALYLQGRVYKLQHNVP